MKLTRLRSAATLTVMGFARPCLLVAAQWQLPRALWRQAVPEAGRRRRLARRAATSAAAPRSPRCRARWGRAEEAPGTAGLNVGGGAQIASVSCASAGNCSAGGYYSNASQQDQAFIINEVDGTLG